MGALRRRIRPGTRPEPVSGQGGQGKLRGVVVAHTAVNGGMMTNFGGLIARRLVEEGAEVHFFASRYPVFGNQPPVREMKDLGVEFHPLPVPQHLAPARDLLTLVLLSWHLRRLQVDVLHTRGTVMGILGRAAGKLAGVPVVLHHTDDLYFREGSLGPTARKWVAVLEREVSRLSDRLFFVSQAVMDDALAVGFDARRSVMVGHDLNPIFEPEIRPDDPRVGRMRGRLRALGVPDGARIVGCVARLAPIKGIDILVEAAARVGEEPGWVYVVRGDGPMLEPLRATVRERGLEGRFFFMTEELPTDEFPALYRCFDLFALPTRREGFGMVFAEAMALGLPVVGPRIAPITEVVPEGCGVLVQAEDPQALAQALRDLMRDPIRRDALARAAEAHARATWCGSARAAERVLREYLSALVEKGVLPGEG